MHRSRTEIALNILESATDGKSIPRIMHDAFVSYEQLSKLLKILKSVNLMTYDPKSRKYMTTNNGLQLLSQYHKNNGRIPFIPEISNMHLWK